ncbi:MAG: DUF4249 domain-containing protein [Cytophagaceae bacterium]|nr:MAG: DUF4249 domain-containing protein [Cytophagaceae bacterium]
MKRPSRFPLRTIGRYIAFTLLYTWLIGCITPYQPESKSLDQPALIVDGFITDQPGPYQVGLSFTADYTAKAVNLRATGAKVTVSDNTNAKQDFIEVAAGIYRTPTTFQGQVGHTYKLTITLADGKRYESTAEKLKAAPPIDKVYDEFTQKETASGLDRGFDVYIDTKDLPTPGDYYRWRWTNFEQIIYCGIKTQTVRSVTTETGQSCCQTCWDVITCTGPNCINTLSDEAVNGNSISRQPILRVPFTSYSKYYVEIEQLSITREAYLFYKSVENLTVSNGGIFDTAPTTVKGNIRSLTSNGEFVFGYFSVSGAQKVPYLVDRIKGKGSPAVKPAVIPPGPLDPCVACVESDYRTRIKPRWWP